jgi:hypothetical protein
MQRLKLSPEKKKAEQDKKRFYMKKFCEAEESIDKAASWKKKDKRRLYVKRCHEAESTHKAATQKNNNNASKKRKCQNESTDAAAT